MLPFSSEAMLAALLLARPGETAVLLGVATVGNVLGSVLNWLIGRFAGHWRERRWFPATPAQLDRAAHWFGRWGAWSLLFAWVPVIGDPLTVAAGLLQVPLGRFVLLVTVGKAFRYAAVAWGVAWL